jgi:outer membrane protein assembly factor BamB
LSAKEQGYAPPTIINAAGRRQLVLFRPDAVSSLDPETGELFWSVPYEATNGLVVMSPVQLGDHLYVGGYSDTNMLIKLATDKPGAEMVWRDERKKAISPINVQPFLDGDVLYGVDQSGEFLAIDLLSGDRLWQTPWPLGERPQRSGTTFIVRQSDRYWLFNDQGELMIAKLSPEGHEEIDRAKVIEPTNVAFGRSVVWSAPAFANKRVYLRNDKECICVDLAK